MRVVLLSLGALVGFAANSLLTRGALASGAIQPAPFALIRVVAGALMLVLIVRLRRPTATAAAGGAPWTAAWSLVGYLIAFTAAYERINASTGALLLFGSVQFTMIAAGIVRGDRPGATDLAGAALALTGLIWLTLPGATAPDLAGAVLMAAAGACWGAYSLIGRRSRDPLADTALNFARASAVVLIPLAFFSWPFDATTRGVVFAVCSGALASGVAYSLWYAALPSLPSWRAATIQLAVPIVTAIAAALMLDESITQRLAVAAAFVAGGMWLTTVKGR